MEFRDQDLYDTTGLIYVVDTYAETSATRVEGNEDPRLSAFGAESLSTTTLSLKIDDPPWAMSNVSYNVAIMKMHSVLRLSALRMFK